MFRAWWAVALGGVSFPGLAEAGAWTQPAGQGQVILSAHYSEADQGFGPVGEDTEIADFRKIELRSFVEYGLTDWATVTVQPEWRDKRVGPGQGETDRGLGRVDAGARVRLYDGERGVFSVQGSVRMPGASDRLAPANGGDTDWEVDARLLYGKGFSVFGLNGFRDMQLGYRVRFGAPADELRLDVTTGLSVTPDIQVLLQSFNSVSIGVADAPFLPTREHKVSASLVYKLDNVWSVQMGGLMVPAGSNALQERGVFMGIWRQF